MSSFLICFPCLSLSFLCPYLCSQCISFSTCLSTYASLPLLSSFFSAYLSSTSAHSPPTLLPSLVTPFSAWLFAIHSLSAFLSSLLSSLLINVYVFNCQPGWLPPRLTLYPFVCYRPYCLSSSDPLPASTLLPASSNSSYYSFFCLPTCLPLICHPASPCLPHNSL